MPEHPLHFFCFMTELKPLLFEKWPIDTLECKDVSLSPYIAIKNTGFVAHSGVKWNTCKFKKATCPIVERFVTTLMMHGRNSGKKCMANRHVKAAFEIIHLATG